MAAGGITVVKYLAFRSSDIKSICEADSLPVGVLRAGASSTAVDVAIIAGLADWELRDNSAQGVSLVTPHVHAGVCLRAHNVEAQVFRYAAAVVVHTLVVEVLAAG